MKMELGTESFVIVGKGWQIRALLRQLANHSLTVDEWLQRQGMLQPRPFTTRS